MERMHYLEPHNGQKSFYGKALVIFKENGTKILMSYDTEVCYLTADGYFYRVWMDYSAATMKHINAFLEEYCGFHINKSIWCRLPYNSGRDVDFMYADMQDERR